MNTETTDIRNIDLNVTATVLDFFKTNSDTVGILQMMDLYETYITEANRDYPDEEVVIEAAEEIFDLYRAGY